MSNTAKANIAAALGYSIMGIGITITKVCLQYSSPFVLIATRTLIAFLVLNLMLCFGRFKLNLKGKPVGKLLLMGLTQPVGHFIFQILGVQRTSSSFTGVILGLTPVMGVLLAVLFLKERCTVLQWVCAAISVIGVILTTTGALNAVDPLGLVFLILAMLGSALFSTLSRGFAKDFAPFERTYVMFGEGAIVFLVLSLFEIKGDLSRLVGPFSSPVFWGGVLFSAIFTCVVSFFLLNYSLSHLPSGRSILYCNLATVISVLLGVLVMHEGFSWMQALGVIIIIVCVFGVVWKKKVPALNGKSPN